MDDDSDMTRMYGSDGWLGRRMARAEDASGGGWLGRRMARTDAPARRQVSVGARRLTSMSSAFLVLPLCLVTAAACLALFLAPHRRVRAERERGREREGE